MRLVPLALLAWLLLAALPGQAVMAPATCPADPVACAQELSALEFGACTTCCTSACMPQRWVSEVVFLKNEGEASILTSVGVLQGEVGRMPAGSPTPGRVTAPMLVFITVSVPAFSDGAAAELSAVLHALEAEPLPAGAQFQPGIVVAVLAAARDARTAMLADPSDAATVVEQAGDELFVALQDCMAWELEGYNLCVASAPSMLQMTVLLQVIVSNAVFAKATAEETAFAALAAAVPDL